MTAAQAVAEGEMWYLLLITTQIKTQTNNYSLNHIYDKMSRFLSVTMQEGPNNNLNLDCKKFNFAFPLKCILRCISEIIEKVHIY